MVLTAKPVPSSQASDLIRLIPFLVCLSMFDFPANDSPGNDHLFVILWLRSASEFALIAARPELIAQNARQKKFRIS